MTPRAPDPERIFVRGIGTAEGVMWGLSLALVTWWVIELELRPLELVLLGTALEISVLVGETPTGVVADLYSRKRSLIISQVLMGSSYVWAVASTNFWVILPAQVAFGLGWTFRTGADTAWVTDELRGMGRATHDDIDRLLLRKQRFGMLAGSAAIMLTVVVGTISSVRWAAILMGALQLGLAVYFARSMTEEHFVPRRSTGSRFRDTLREGLGAVSTRPKLRVLVGVVLAIELGGEGFDRLGFKHLIDSAKLDDDSLPVLGLIFLALVGAGLIVNALASSALRRGRGVARVAVGLLLIATVGGLLASITSAVVVIALGFMAQDSMREAVFPVLEGWANRDAPSEVRATVHSLMGQVGALGQLSGGLLLGTIAEFTSVRFVLVIAAALYGVSGLLATRGIVPRTQPVS